MILKSVKGGWELQKEIIYTNGDLGVTIYVKPKFFTDLASIPRIFRWWVSNQDDRVRFPSVIHDYLYAKKGRCYLYDTWHTTILERKEVDILFYKMLRERGMDWFKAWTMYMAVRIGGSYD